MTLLNLDTVPGRRAFKLDQVVVRTVGGEEGAGVLEVLALRLALERLVGRLEEPVCEEDAAVRRGQRVGDPIRWPERVGGGPGVSGVTVRVKPQFH